MFIPRFLFPPAEYEAKASELALDLQVEQKALTLAREQLATTQRGRAWKLLIATECKERLMLDRRV